MIYILENWMIYWNIQICLNKKQKEKSSRILELETNI